MFWIGFYSTVYWTLLRIKGVISVLFPSALAFNGIFITQYDREELIPTFVKDEKSVLHRSNFSRVLQHVVVVYYEQPRLITSRSMREPWVPEEPLSCSSLPRRPVFHGILDCFIHFALTSYACGGRYTTTDELHVP